MCIRDSIKDSPEVINSDPYGKGWMIKVEIIDAAELNDLLDASAYQALIGPVSYTHLRAHETVLDIVCRLLLEKKKKN